MRFLLAGLALLAAGQSAHAQDVKERVTAGTLTCKADAAESLTEPVQRGISCTYEPVDTGTKAVYSGDIIHKGPANPGTQLAGSDVLVWNVWVPKGTAAEPSLLGKYFGVRTTVPDRPGTGANDLVGGEDEAIMLRQVLNPGTGAAPDATTSIIELELRPART